MQRALLLTILAVLTSTVFLTPAAHATWYWNTQTPPSCIYLAIAHNQLSSTSTDMAYWARTGNSPNYTYYLKARVNDNLVDIIEPFYSPEAGVYKSPACPPAISVFADGSFYVAWAEMYCPAEPLTKAAHINLYYTHFYNNGDPYSGEEKIEFVSSESDSVALPDGNTTHDELTQNLIISGMAFGGIKFYDPNHFSIGYARADYTDVGGNIYYGDGDFFEGYGYFTQRRRIMMCTGESNGVKSYVFRCNTWYEGRGTSVLTPVVAPLEYLYPEDAVQMSTPFWRYSTNGDGTHDVMGYIVPNNDVKNYNYYPGSLNVMLSTGTEVSISTSTYQGTPSYGLVTTSSGNIHVFYPGNGATVKRTFDPNLNLNTTVYSIPCYDSKYSLLLDAVPILYANNDWFDLLLSHDGGEDDTSYTYVYHKRSFTGNDLITDAFYGFAWPSYAGNPALSHFGARRSWNGDPEGNAAYLNSWPSSTIAVK